MPLREEQREAALEPLRRRNFETVLERLAACGAVRGELLDVGCAHGWFLDAARRRGYVASGIEPDAAIAAQAVRRGHTVTHGRFPQALPAGVRFDVIVFNDVFEHLPDPRGALGAVHAALRPGG
ncbi:MAG TPA: class I SAM-dependent methyltransferase, partial [Casimicrobiaceae bacterium]